MDAIRFIQFHNNEIPFRNQGAVLSSTRRLIFSTLPHFLICVIQDGVTGSWAKVERKVARWILVLTSKVMMKAFLDTWSMIQVRFASDLFHLLKSSSHIDNAIVDRTGHQDDIQDRRHRYKKNKEGVQSYFLRSCWSCKTVTFATGNNPTAQVIYLTVIGFNALILFLREIRKA